MQYQGTGYISMDCPSLYGTAIGANPRGLWHMVKNICLQWYVNMMLMDLLHWLDGITLRSHCVFAIASAELILCCLSRYYCIVDNRVIIAFVNSSLYSCDTYRQVKEMVTLHLFVESPLQIHCIKHQRRHILTLHLSTAN